MKRVAFLVAVAVVVPASSAAPPRVQTLVYAKGPISAFAQDGRWLAWETLEQTKCGLTMRIRDLGRKFQDVVACGRIAPARQVAVANGRALWRETEYGNQQYHRLYTASLTGKVRTVYSEEGLYSSGDPHDFSLVGDGAVLGYVRWRGGDRDEDACVDTGDRDACRNVVKDGGYFRVGPAGSAKVRNVPPARLAAAAAGKMAIVAVGNVGEPPAARALIQVRNATSGALLAEWSLVEHVHALAFDGSRWAVLHKGRIAGRELASGRAFSYAVPSDAAGLSMSERAIVFHAGPSIRVAGRGEVARAVSVPIGLSIDGRRIAWAETVRGRGRVQSLELR